LDYRKLLACSTLILGLAACGSSDNGSSADNASGGATDSTSTSTAAQPQAAPEAANVTAERLVNAANEPGQWMTTGGDYEEHHFSRLDQVNTGNVGQLGLAWYSDIETNLNQEGTPLMIDGVIYATSAWSHVYAIDAKTGERLWHYDPKVPGERGGLGCCSVVNRGVAAWNGKIFVGAYDGRLIAIDAKTGKEVWSVMTVDQDWPYSITGAPRVVKGKVIIGNGGAELGVRGYVTAYDAETGEKVWRFYTVPGNPAEGPDGEASDKALADIAQDTWTGEYWRIGGGGTVWDGMVYDPKLDLLYIGVGNGSPWNAAERSPDGGDNLFLSSIVALNPDTGEYVWHFQEVPWESWDYTATAPFTVADIDFNGQTRRVVMQMPKNGVFYVLDAKTGEFISAKNMVPQNWYNSIDPVTGRPDIKPEAHYDKTGEPYIVMPGPQAAHSWHPAAFSPETGLIYMPARYTSLPLISAPRKEIGVFNLGVDWISGAYLYDKPENKDLPKDIDHQLIAWNPVTQEPVWKSPMTGDGGAGVLATAGGLVFQGISSKEQLVAYDAQTGEEVWHGDVQTGIVAAPISYELDGEQYIAVTVGAAVPGATYYTPNYSRVLAFKIGGTATLPEKTPFAPPTLDPPELEASADVVKHGQELYSANCSICHGEGGAVRGALFPDLRYSSALWAQEDFDAIVLDGLRADNGMRPFKGVLSEEDTAAVRSYIVSIANELKEQQTDTGQAN